MREEADWVRTEILAAQTSGTRVVPVIKGRKTDRLARASLPRELMWLADVHSLRLDMHESTDDLARIGDFLADVVPVVDLPAEGPAVRLVCEAHLAFLDSLDPAPSDDVRLTLTSQVARLVDSHDQKAADEMRRRHSEPDGGDVADSYWGYPGEAEGTPPE